MKETSGILRAHVAEQIGAITWPRQIFIVTELSKTRSGKIMRWWLRGVAEGRPIGDTTALDDPDVTKLTEEVSRQPS